MTRDELRKHCEKTVETQLRYKNSTNGLEQFHSKKVLSEHQLILELLDREESVVKALEDVRAEIILLSDKADRECKVSNSYSVRDRLRTKAQAYDDVAKMIDQKIKEIKNERS